MLIQTISGCLTNNYNNYGVYPDILCRREKSIYSKVIIATLYNNKLWWLNDDLTQGLNTSILCKLNCSMLFYRVNSLIKWFFDKKKFNTKETDGHFRAKIGHYGKLPVVLMKGQFNGHFVTVILVFEKQLFWYHKFLRYFLGKNVWNQLKMTIWDYGKLRTTFIVITK